MTIPEFIEFIHGKYDLDNGNAEIYPEERYASFEGNNHSRVSIEWDEGDDLYTVKCKIIGALEDFNVDDAFEHLYHSVPQRPSVFLAELIEDKEQFTEVVTKLRELDLKALETETNE